MTDTSTNLFSRLLVSAPNGGGVFAVVAGSAYQLDHRDTTGLILRGEVLARALQPNVLQLYSRHSTRDVELEGIADDLHDIFEHGGRYYLVGTRKNCVLELSKDGTLLQHWDFHGEEDSCHINCLGLWRGRIVFSSFGDFTSTRAYKSGSRGRGLVRDLLSGETLIKGLSQPHSLVGCGENLLLANSEDEEIVEFGSDGRRVRSVKLGGYTRGICFADNILYVALSAPRHLDHPIDSSATIVALDRDNWNELGRLELVTREVYSIVWVQSADEFAGWTVKIASDSAERFRAPQPGARSPTCDGDQKLHGQCAVPPGGESVATALREPIPALSVGPIPVELDAAALARELEGVRFERDRAHEAVMALRGSASWRVTAPIRAVARQLQGGSEGLSVVLEGAIARMSSTLPAPWRNFLHDTYLRTFGRLAAFGESAANYRAISDIVAIRCAPAASPREAERFIPIDISVVLFNDERWLNSFAASVEGLQYPKDMLHVVFVDNGSTDGSMAMIESIAKRWRASGARVTVRRCSNNGYGAGHNAGIAEGNSEFVLVTNVDVEFEPDALSLVVEHAVRDVEQIAAWELRQIPFEHPKYYDPVTGLTNWNSHACVLLRRSALDDVGGYDENLFMYGEDVELSYRLRRGGYLLRYIPRAAIVHHSFTSTHVTKPLQFSGSTLANFYLRFKYGSLGDMLAAPVLLLRLPFARALPASLRQLARANVRKAGTTAWRGLSSRRNSYAAFPFRRWDYDMIRDGADIASSIIRHPPLVTIVTRTVRGREALLRQAILSVFNQTYGAIEHIVAQDGGSDVEAAIAEIPIREGYRLRFLGLPKVGRSAAGNAGLRAATGRWCIFLDDDDLMFADHVEVLVGAILEAQAEAAYSLAWEVATSFKAGGAGVYEELSHLVPRAYRQTFDHRTLRHHNFMPIQSVLFERSLFEERGGFEEDMDALEDWVLWNKYALGSRFTHVARVTSMYRVPGAREVATKRHQVLTAAYPVAVSRISLNEHRFQRGDFGKAIALAS